MTDDDGDRVSYVAVALGCYEPEEEVHCVGTAGTILSMVSDVGASKALVALDGALCLLRHYAVRRWGVRVLDGATVLAAEIRISLLAGSAVEALAQDGVLPAITDDDRRVISMDELRAPDAAGLLPPASLMTGAAAAACAETDRATVSLAAAEVARDLLVAHMLQNDLRAAVTAATAAAAIISHGVVSSPAFDALMGAIALPQKDRDVSDVNVN